VTLSDTMATAHPQPQMTKARIWLSAGAIVGVAVIAGSIALAVSSPSTSTAASSRMSANRAACEPNTLNVAIGSPGGGLGHGGEVVILTNVSPAVTCSLEGFPTVELRNTSGSNVPVLIKDTSSASWLFSAVPLTPVRLAPGKKASFWMEWENVNGLQAGVLAITPPGATGHLNLANLFIELNVGDIAVSPVTRGVILPAQNAN
jgi:hypothetical protein